MPFKCIIVYVTFPSLEVAKEIARTAIEKKYARCVNLIPSALSLYEWEGKIEESSECIGIFKTLSTIDLTHHLLQTHPYQIPAIIYFEGETTEKFHNYLLFAD